MQSISDVTHAEPTVALYGRIALNKYVGYVVTLGKPSLHFAVVIFDNYTGILGVDGQPSFDVEFDLKSDYLINKNLMKIKTNFYKQELPTDIVIKINITPPAGMSGQKFAQELMRRAHAFKNYSSEYSFPVGLGRGKMNNKNEYNSSSYVAGLLNSVMGYVPKISTPDYQTPGWETPVPANYFK